MSRTKDKNIRNICIFRRGKGRIESEWVSRLKMMRLALAITLPAVRASGTRLAALAGSTEWALRMPTPGCPDYENTAALGATASVKCI